LQLVPVPQDSATEFVPARRLACVVTADQSFQLAVGGSVSVRTVLPLTTRSMVRGAGPPSAPR
jgi:hypothetical protein